MTRLLAIGTQVHGYRVTRPLGRGGMGQIWAAIDMQTGDHVALKLLTRPSEDSAILARFEREARVLAKLDHPHIRRVHSFFMLEDGEPVMVMEHLVGESLKQRLERDKTIAVSSLCRLLLPVVSAIGFAHELGVVHRDLKPANIFLPTSAGGAVKVLDFGIAKMTSADEDGTASLTISGALLGTPSYMSPEQVFGRKDIDHRTDIWSLGMILYEALSGVLPTRGESVGDAVKRIMAPIPPLEDLVPHLPNELAVLVSAMLASEPDQRPESLINVEATLARMAFPSFAPPQRATRNVAHVVAQAASTEGSITLDPSPFLRAKPRVAAPMRNARVLVVGFAAAIVGLTAWVATRPSAQDPAGSMAVEATSSGGDTVVSLEAPRAVEEVPRGDAPPQNTSSPTIPSRAPVANAAGTGVARREESLLGRPVPAPKSPADDLERSLDPASAAPDGVLAGPQP